MLKTKTSKIVCATLAIFFLVTGVIMLILTVAFKDQLTQDKSSKTNLPGKKMPQSVEESTTAEEESTGNEREKTDVKVFLLNYYFDGNFPDGYIYEFREGKFNDSNEYEGEFKAYDYNFKESRSISSDDVKEPTKGGNYKLKGDTLILNDDERYEFIFGDENRCESSLKTEHKFLLNEVNGVTDAFYNSKNSIYLIPVISKNVLNDPADRKESFSGTTDATTEQSTEDTTQATTEEETKETATISADEAKEKAIEYYKKKYTSLNEHNAYIKDYRKTVNGIICYEITVSRVNADDKKETDSKTIYVPHDGTAAFELSEYNVKRP